MSENFKIGDTLTPKQAMDFAIDLATNGMGFVKTNPPVGCVILDSSKCLIGYGFHNKFGDSHAEVHAIKSVDQKDKLSGSTFYITLEPCSHTGKTPPCTEEILRVKAKKVVYAMSDPNPKVSGCGLKKLMAAGVVVEKFDLESVQLKKLNWQLASFFHNIKFEKSFVTLKVASSLDGFIAKKSGESQWITGEKARHHVHKLRGQHDAILIGRATLEKDNPSLDIRHSDFKGKELKVIVLDPSLKTLREKQKFQLFEKHKPENIIFIHAPGEATNSSYSINFLQIPHARDTGFDLDELWQKLYVQHGIGSVLVEGGAGTHSKLLNQKSFQKLCLYIGPKILGQKNSISWTKELSIESLSDSVEFEDIYSKSFGEDILISAKLST